MRVVIADDSAAIRRRLAVLLSESGIEVVGEAGDGSRALRLAERLAPDALVLDIRMPRLGGLEVLRRLCVWQRPPRVVMLSNHPLPQYRKACAALGAEAFLDKATQFDRVVDVLRRPQRAPLPRGEKRERRHVVLALRRVR